MNPEASTEKVKLFNVFMVSNLIIVLFRHPKLEWIRNEIKFFKTLSEEECAALDKVSFDF